MIPSIICTAVPREFSTRYSRTIFVYFYISPKTFRFSNCQSVISSYEYILTVVYVDLDSQQSICSDGAIHERVVKLRARYIPGMYVSTRNIPNKMWKGAYRLLNGQRFPSSRAPVDLYTAHTHTITPPVNKKTRPFVRAEYYSSSSSRQHNIPGIQQQIGL